MKRLTSVAFLLAAAALAAPAGAQLAAPRVVEGFADLADLTLASPVILQATVAKADRIPAKQAPGLGANRARFLIEADVTALLRSPDAVPGHILYLWDTPLDARGKAPKLKKTPVLAFLTAGDRPGEYRLVNAQGQIAPTPAALAAVRAVLADSLRPDLMSLRITGVTSAFHVPGSIPGEAESQIFLSTADKRPISLVVLSRPGQSRTYSVATGDVIDEAAKAVKPNTLLWYQLACRLPRTLPDAATSELDDSARAAVREDYQFVLGALGPCARALS